MAILTMQSLSNYLTQVNTCLRVNLIVTIILIIYSPCLGQYNPNPPYSPPSGSSSSFGGYPFGDPVPFKPGPLSHSYPKSPADLNRYYHSDSRCMDDILTYNPEDVVYVTTKYGKISGRISYLCDYPGLPLRDRPAGSTWGIGGNGRPVDWQTYQSQSGVYGPVNSPFNTNYGSQGMFPPSSNANAGAFSRIRARVRSNVTLFLGVPFAKPPTNTRGLRFKPPQPPEHWGSLEAIDFRPSCPQPVKYTGVPKMIKQIDEDCLYMNIYSPYVQSQISDPYPVMVYIHGGNFEHGSGNVFPGHMLAASQKVVVVSFNYRLGLLGFFATADNASAGNFGLLDQVQALHFVRENIRYFNGDPERITLFGPGSGAASAGLLALSPLSSRFVRRVIASSGSAVAPQSVHRTHTLIRNNSIVAGYSYGCRTYHSWKLTECLNSRSFADISVSRIKPDVGWSTFAPVPDFATRPRDLQVMPHLPEDLLATGHYRHPNPDFTYLTGVTKDEGASILLEDEDFVRRGWLADKMFFKDKVKEYIRIFNATLNPDAFFQAISFMYSPYTDADNDTLIRRGLVDMYSDSYVVSGVDKMVKLLLKNNIRTFMYVLNYTLDGLPASDWNAVPHDEEYFLAAGAPFMDHRFFPSDHKLKDATWSEADRNMSQFFMESWANFAKYGNPTPQALFNTIYWKPMSLKTLQYLSVNTTNYTSIMHRDYRQKECQFWSEYLPSISMSAPPVWPPLYEPLEIELRIYKASTWAVLAALILMIFLTALCSCLYCRAKRDRWGDAAIDDYLPNLDKVSAQYSAPSTRANSETSLRSLSRSRDRVDFTQLKPGIKVPRETKDLYLLYHQRQDNCADLPDFVQRVFNDKFSSSNIIIIKVKMGEDDKKQRKHNKDKKKPKGKKSLVKEDVDPTAIIAPSDYQHIYSEKNKKETASSSKKSSKESSSGKKKPPEEQGVTAMIAPEDYEHIYSDKDKKTPSKKTFSGSSSSTGSKSPPQEQEPGITAMIAPEDYEHIYDSKKAVFKDKSPKLHSVTEDQYQGGYTEIIKDQERKESVPRERRSDAKRDDFEEDNRERYLRRDNRGEVRDANRVRDDREKCRVERDRHDGRRNHRRVNSRDRQDRSKGKMMKLMVQEPDSVLTPSKIPPKSVLKKFEDGSRRVSRKINISEDILDEMNRNLRQ